MNGSVASNLLLVLVGFAIIVRTLRGQLVRRTRDLIGGLT